MPLLLFLYKMHDFFFLFLYKMSIVFLYKMYYNKLNKTKTTQTKTTQTKQRKEVKRMRTELMKDVKEFIKFNDLIHKDYDEVINEFSDENLTDEEMDEIENLLFENEDEMEEKELQKMAEEAEMARNYEADIKWLNREYRAMARVS